MTLSRTVPAATLAALVSLACQRETTAAPAAASAPESAAAAPAAPSAPAKPAPSGAAPAAKPASPSPATAPGKIPWTPERVRAFVLETHLSLEKVVNDLTRKRDRNNIIGECYDSEPAGALGKLADILPILQKRITGPALPCYLASYFGCTVGPWVGRAGIAKVGPGLVPFTRSRVTIVEQTPDRVVADVIEADINAVIDGEINRDEISEKTEATLKEKSRYTLTRDPTGTWRISDRQLSADWECRPR